MPLRPPIFLAAGDDSLIDVVFWVVAGAFWLIAQIHAAKKKQERQKRAAAAPPATRSAEAANVSDADELAEIFKRLGANVPDTPPPPSRPAQPAVRPGTVPARPTARPAMRTVPQAMPARAPRAASTHMPKVAPAVAQRLARAKQAAAEAARRAEEARQAEADAALVAGAGVHSRTDDTAALDSALRRTGAVMPRIGAMDMRFAAWPHLPLPGFAPVQRTGAPLRAKLNARREIRDALVAQVFLQPPKGLAR